MPCDSLLIWDKTKYLILAWCINQGSLLVLQLLSLPSLSYGILMGSWKMECCVCINEQKSCPTNQCALADQEVSWFFTSVPENAVLLYKNKREYVAMTVPQKVIVSQVVLFRTRHKYSSSCCNIFCFLFWNCIETECSISCRSRYP